MESMEDEMESVEDAQEEEASSDNESLKDMEKNAEIYRQLRD